MGDGKHRNSSINFGNLSSVFLKEFSKKVFYNKEEFYNNDKTKGKINPFINCFGWEILQMKRKQNHSKILMSIIK